MNASLYFVRNSSPTVRSHSAASAASERLVKSFPFSTRARLQRTVSTNGLSLTVLVVTLDGSQVSIPIQRHYARIGDASHPKSTQTQTLPPPLPLIQTLTLTLPHLGNYVSMFPVRVTRWRRLGRRSARCFKMS